MNGHDPIGVPAQLLIHFLEAARRRLRCRGQFACGGQPPIEFVRRDGDVILEGERAESGRSAQRR